MKSKYLLALALAFISSKVHADNLDPNLVTQLAGRFLVTGRCEATQGLQTDKQLEFISISTPSYSPASNHAFFWFNETAKQFCSKYDDGSSGCISTSGGSIAASSIAAGSLGPAVIASSITLAAMYGSPTLNAANITNIQGAQVGSGVLASNIASGSLGASVIASSIAINAVYPASVKQGDYTTIQGLAMQNQALNMGSNKITSLTNGSASSDAAAYGQIFVGLQKDVQCTVTSSSSTTGTSFINSNLSCTITPTSSSNRIKVTVSGGILVGDTSVSGYLTIARGATNLAGATGFSIFNYGSGSNQQTPYSITYIDSPATTGSTVYNLQFRGDAAGHTVQVTPTSTTSVMVLEEIQ